METAIQVFKFEGNRVRTTEDGGQIWFAAKDVATALRYSDLSNPARLFQSVPEEWKGVKPIHTPYGTQDMVVISEQGLYFFLARSDKPKALPFQKWIAGDIIPSIRKYGAYMTIETIEKTLTNPDFIIGLATKLKEEQQKNVALVAKVEQDAPKVLFADAVTTSKTSILIWDLAKILKQNGIDIGGNRLFQWLRDNGFLFKTGSSKNMPTQSAMDMGLFEVRESTRVHSDGHVSIDRTTKVTGRGQLYFVNRFIRDAKAA